LSNARIKHETSQAFEAIIIQNASVRAPSDSCFFDGDSKQGRLALLFSPDKLRTSTTRREKFECIFKVHSFLIPTYLSHVTPNSCE
jgi:hypothetical protein